MPRPVSNPPNPWTTQHVEWLEEPPAMRLQVFEEDAKSILTKNESPDIPFHYSLNPYRGCQHGCAYCYARRSHELLGFGAGTDFDSKIVVKRNAPELLRRALAKRSWRGDWIAFSGITDCYQPLEASYGLTRECLEICAEFKNPAGVITKSALVRRDIDVLQKLARVASVQVHLSVPFADDATGRAIEPLASAPGKRFETAQALSAAGIPVGIAIAPLIPGLNDSDVPEILERAREAGATSAFLSLLHLSADVRAVFEERLRTAFPDRADKVLHALTDMRQGQGGRANDFGTRMHGGGARWESVKQLFEVHAKRLGLRTTAGRELDTLTPNGAGASRTLPQQGELF